MKRKRTSKPNSRVVTGTIWISRRGVGFLKDPQGGEDILIERDMLTTAFPGDEVRVALLPHRDGKRGEVLEVLRRARTSFVGTLVKKEGGIVLIPDNQKIQTHFILEPLGNQAEVGDKVFIRFISWKENARYPLGKIEGVLGKSGEHNTEMNSILLDRGFKAEFSSEVEKEASRIVEKEDREEMNQRRDFRDVPTFTIDPENAKDFDDALSFRKIAEDRFELGVHIADVSHYVSPESLLDQEARERGFSVYLVDRTIPMLPEALSNNLASLSPNEEKRAFSAVFEIGINGEVYNEWFGKTRIISRKRFTYEEAQEVINNHEGSHANELMLLTKITSALRKKRFFEGAINFQENDISISLDASGKPVDIKRKPHLGTHELIEECMLLANRRVAHFFFHHVQRKTKEKSLPPPFIYRIHDEPDYEKLTVLFEFLKTLNLPLPKFNKRVSAKEINAVLQAIEGHATESLVKNATVRSMAKALYTTKNIGHFGLAFKYYTHFTSPIRRYPDLLVHRLLFSALQGKPIGADEIDAYEGYAREASGKEVRAADAERASIKYKQVEYMEAKKGEIFNGIISGVTEWGLYVEEKESRSEGMVHISTLPGNDFYHFNEKTYSLVGEKSKRTFTLGDEVRVSVVGTDLAQRTISYELVV